MATSIPGPPNDGSPNVRCPGLHRPVMCRARRTPYADPMTQNDAGEITRRIEEDLRERLEAQGEHMQVKDVLAVQ